MEKKIIVKGGLGVSARRDRCVDRIIDRGGVLLLPSGSHQSRQAYGYKEVQRIGQAHAVESQSGIVYSRRKSIVTLIAGTHGYAIGYVVKKWQEKK